jgi:hypothetical protein
MMLVYQLNDIWPNVVCPIDIRANVEAPFFITGRGGSTPVAKVETRRRGGERRQRHLRRGNCEAQAPTRCRNLSRV